MPLVDDVRAIVNARPGTFGIYARHLGTGEVVAVDAERVLPTESAAKTFILVHYARLVSTGALDPSRRVTPTDDRVLGTGVLRYLAPGLELSLDDLAWLMIIVSDNLATHMLRREVGEADAVNATMAGLGLDTAWLNPAFSHAGGISGEQFGTSTPRDLAEVYTHLDERARAILFRQRYVDYLPRRLPHYADATDIGFAMPVRVFNKTGNGLGTCTDSGLFETDTAAWVVAAMATDQQDFASRADDAAPTAFAEIGGLLYDRWRT